MEGAFDRGVDFSYSNELTIDHSIIVPMMFVRPEMDIPIVPILTNCIAPPMPRAKTLLRSRQSDPRRHRQPADQQTHRRARQRPSIPGSRRPEKFEPHLTDPNFDANAVGWIVNGDIDAAAEACAPEKMLQYGNMTTGYLNFLMMMGVANLAKPSYAEGLDAGFPGDPVF